MSYATQIVDCITNLSDSLQQSNEANIVLLDKIAKMESEHKTVLSKLKNTRVVVKKPNEEPARKKRLVVVLKANKVVSERSNEALNFLNSIPAYQDHDTPADENLWCYDTKPDISNLQTLTPNNHPVSINNNKIYTKSCYRCVFKFGKHPTQRCHFLPHFDEYNNPIGWHKNNLGFYTPQRNFPIWFRKSVYDVWEFYIYNNSNITLASYDECVAIITKRKAI